PRDPMTVVARTTFGLLVTSDGGQSWHWICEAAVGIPVLQDPAIAITSDGSILVATSAGLMRGTEGACRWTRAAPPLDTMALIDLALDPGMPSRAWLLPSRDAPAAVYLTEDDGAHWSP